MSSGTAVDDYVESFDQLSPSSDSISDAGIESTSQNETLTQSQAWNLYASHFLSTWNMRMYEFAAIIFTAVAYPNTLLATSIRGIVRTLAAICFSASIGRWVDQSPSRLKTLTTSIVVNRLSIVAACGLWYLIVQHERSSGHGSLLPVLSNVQSAFEGTSKNVTFSAILVLGVLETLSASGNTLSMERDWVVVVASPSGRPYDLIQLNSAMRRIDLTCKLLAPIFISVVISSANTNIGVMIVGAMSACSFLIELLCAKRVWDTNPKLRVLKSDTSELRETDPRIESHSSGNSVARIKSAMRTCAGDFVSYFSSPVWVPSMALAILHVSVLTYSATLITFLLNIGFRMDIITLARAAGSIVEISSTLVTPIGIRYLSMAKKHGRRMPGTAQVEEAISLMGHSPEDQGTEIGLSRLGLWGLSWQLINLMPVVVSLWSLSSRNSDGTYEKPSIMNSLTLFFFPTSRLGLWIYDLTTQQLTQMLTIPSTRSSFGGVENSFVNLFDLLQYVVAIMLHKPEQFVLISSMSLMAVATSTVMYASWVFRMRGHLVHWDTLLKGCECVKTRLRP